jgi:hypothetical protein
LEKTKQWRGKCRVPFLAFSELKWQNKKQKSKKKTQKRIAAGWLVIFAQKHNSATAVVD